ncbi:arginine repressor [Staphylococcus capitis]|uniref:arginine repressor n=1 Tax=Staphylococcus capitis TaxID=29388 RepID=UPI00211E964B|nr:ArgR family transcriptional regulator [Staphylococcus capitis]
MKKSKRQDLVTMIVKQNHIYKKADIVDYIDDNFGIRYSMTTIARDLRELNIFRLPAESKQFEYKILNNQSQIDAKIKLDDYLETEIISTVIKESYILIKTSPGFAQCINYYIDQLQLKEIVGTISGNDTIMILTHSKAMAEYVYYKIFNHNYS